MVAFLTIFGRLEPATLFIPKSCHFPLIRACENQMERARRKKKSVIYFKKGYFCYFYLVNSKKSSTFAAESEIYNTKTYENRKTDNY